MTYEWWLQNIHNPGDMTPGQAMGVCMQFFSDAQIDTWLANGITDWHYALFLAETDHGFEDCGKAESWWDGITKGN